MDYKFVQLLTTIGLILCIINAIGCINYLCLALMGFGYIHGVIMQTIFGISGVILVIATVLAYKKFEETL